MTKISNGWIRILILLSVIWLSTVAIFAIADYKSIDKSELFHKAPHEYTYWKWVQVRPDTTDKDGWMSSGKEITIKLNKVIAVAATPLVILWFIAWSISWVKEGFNIDRDS